MTVRRQLAYHPAMSKPVAHVLIVNANWDDEAKVWVAESDAVPGLATEAASLDALVAKLREMIPELHRHFTVDGKIKSRHTAMRR